MACVLLALVCALLVAALCLMWECLRLERRRGRERDAARRMNASATMRSPAREVDALQGSSVRVVGSVRTR